MGPEEDSRLVVFHRSLPDPAFLQHCGRHTGPCGSGEAAQARRRATRWGEPFAHARHPNDVWAIDLKGWFRTDDGMRIDPLTAQDAMSRYLLVCHALDRPAGPEVRRLFGEDLPRVRHPSGHTHRQWSALRQCGSGQPLATLGMVGQAGDRTRTHRARTPRTEWTH